MPVVASRYDHMRGQTHGTGHCVSLVCELAGLPQTSMWRRGDPVLGGNFAEGTVIATFDRSGRYANATDGSSHAAILIAEVPGGLNVFDQWVGKVAGERIIRNKRGAGPSANDASRYYTVEIADA